MKLALCVWLMAAAGQESVPHPVRATAALLQLAVYGQKLGLASELMNPNEILSEISVSINVIFLI